MRLTCPSQHELSSVGETKSSTKPEQRQWVQTGCDCGRRLTFIMGTLSCPGLNSARLHKVMIFDKEAQVPELWSKVCSGKQEAQWVPWVLEPTLCPRLVATPGSAPPLESTALSQTERSRKLTRVVFTGVGREYLTVKPQMGHGHPVLGEGPGLVGADDRGGAQRLHGLQVLHQAVLLGHPLGCQ